ncbi:hypothetical protein ACJIZ3_018933 [Penstemon smallii]|uniref:Uncharacterized protein n=1 Tax=Penstemon smallii TaxID=265156 RepID=A0ABD3T0E3_9LAMI
MAMSRILSQSFLPRSASLHPPSALISHHKRHRSNKSHRAQLIELDLDSPTSSSLSQSDEVIAVGMKRLEDAIHGMIVRRAAPDWLPFLPGYSYWVPPQRSSGFRNHPSAAGTMIEMIGKLAVSRKSTKTRDLLSEDEHMAYTSSKGWPSSAFFIQGTSPRHPIPVVEMEVKIQDDEDSSDDTSNSENEEG